MTTTHRALTFLGTLAAGAMIAASTIATTHAEPAPIDDGSGPREVGAQIDDGSGAPGPDHRTPIDIPSVGPAPVKPDASAPQSEWDKYAQDKRQHDTDVQARENAIALERARVQAERQKDCTRTDHEIGPCW
jgi:hypothetical protein